MALSAAVHHYVGNMHKSMRHQPGGGCRAAAAVRTGHPRAGPDRRPGAFRGRHHAPRARRRSPGWGAPSSTTGCGEGIDLGVLAEVEAAPSGQRRGRPSRSIRFRTEAGVILAASLGEVSLHAAVTDLDGRDLVREFRSIDVQDGPEKVLRAVHESFRRLLRRLGTPAPVWAVSVGLPAPMDYRDRPRRHPAGPFRAGPGSTSVRGSPPATTPRSGWTTRSTSGRWASGSAGSRRSAGTCSTSRWPPASAAAWSPAAGCTAATAARPATSATCGSPTTPPPSAAAARPAAWRRSPAAGPSCARSPTARVPARARCWPNGSPRSATSPARTSAAPSPRATRRPARRSRARPG